MTHAPSDDTYAILLQTARQSIEQFLQGDAINVPAIDEAYNQTRGVFVILWEQPKKLRGCMGRTQGITPTLSQEVAECAILAATRDPRFEPVKQRDELQNINIELSLLMPLEPIEDKTELDPYRYGVVVSVGNRRGLLLPNVDGVQSVEEQLRIACQKGKIDRDENFELARFEVLKISDAHAAD
jgi:AmmeMemoRadiSam system protein A